jgi:hypothetical protein
MQNGIICLNLVGKNVGTAATGQNPGRTVSLENVDEKCHSSILGYFLLFPN